MLKEILEKMATKQYDDTFLIKNNFIPFFKEMSEELGYLQEDKECYHLTTIKYIQDLAKIQNTDKTISGFSKGGNDLMKLPVISSGMPILVKIKGDCILEGNADLYTFPDKQGRRWIKTDFPAGKKLNFFLSGFSKKALESKNPFETYYNKILDWLDEGGYKILNKFLKDNIQTNYNECLMTNFKIKEIYWLNEVNKDEIQKIAISLGVKSDFFEKNKIIDIKI